MKMQSYFISLSKASRSFILSMLAVITPFYLARFVGVFDVGIIVLFSIAFSTLIIYLLPALKAKNGTKMYLIAGTLVIALLLNFIFLDFYVFIFSLILGSISLSGRDISPNQPIEQYAMAYYETDIRSKRNAFSLYNFFSYSSSIVASIFLFLYVNIDYRVVFLILTLVALSQFILYLFIKFPQHKKMKGKDLDSETKKRVFSLSYLFSMDALAGGMVTVSMISLYFKYVYHISLSTAGLIFIIVNVITTISILISPIISSKIGLIRTMVYTHSVSNIFLMLVPIFHALIISEIFLFLRQATSQMDVPARDTLVNTIIDEDYRVNSNSIFSVVRNGSQIPGPGLVGAMMTIFPPFMFIAGGALKLSYDILFFVKYRKIKI
ncbi:MFS transporter [Ferroplasma sp.]|uniref:MFS transporter n=1 Tax=Ferroplasma sp. TaxID=2591003 RepID=UPI002610537A|nr:MFS transporter [Ferroplasma sp.]